MEKIPLNFSLPRYHRELLIRAAAAEDRSVSAVIRRAMSEYIAQLVAADASNRETVRPSAE